MLPSSARPVFFLVLLGVLWPVTAHGLMGATRTASGLEGNPELNVQIFRPSPHRGSMPSVLSPGVSDHLSWSAGAMFSVGRNPFTFCKPDQVAQDGTVTPGCDVERHEVVQELTGLDVMGSISLFDWVDVGLAVPVFASIAGEFGKFAEPIEPVPSSALGDIRVSVKTRSWDLDLGALEARVGANLLVGLPTGDPNAFVSDGFQVAPVAVADLRMGPISVAGNLGLNIRPTTTTVLVDAESVYTSAQLEQDPSLDADVEYIRVGSGLIWRVGTTLNVLGEDRALADVHAFELTLVGELNGNSANVLGDEEVGVDNKFSTANANNLEGTLGVRVGLPDLGLSLDVGGGSGMVKGYGNTKYRVYAGASFSPPMNRDEDRDGLVDEVDACPSEAEDFDGYQDDDGCPEVDNDEDGLPDGVDRCPNDAEDMDGFKDADGCPEPDNDGDGVLDAADKCPMDAEDMDGFEDADGCPDNDNDGDGVPDSADDCPDEAETMNGHQDTDGCPDDSLAKLDADTARIVILDNVYFASNRDTIKPQSFPVLKAVAGLLQANPSLKKVRIEGHTDQRGGKGINQRLSKARAEAVKAFLVAEGIAEDRMEAVGMGKSRPIAEGRGKKARSANRRVEFVIINE